MTNAQQEIQAVIDDLSAKIIDLETRAAALKDVREFARNLLSKYEPNLSGMTAQQAVEFVDKELPNSGIYGSLYVNPSAENEAVNYADESGYTAEDKAAALVHDALDPALVELCGKTTIHADEDGWIPHNLEGCPIENLDAKLQVMNRKTGVVSTLYAGHVEWGYGFRKESYPDLVVSKWRYAK